MPSPTQWTWVWANSGDGEGQGSLHSIVHGVPQSWTQVSNWMTTTIQKNSLITSYHRCRTNIYDISTNICAIWVYETCKTQSTSAEKKEVLMFLLPSIHISVILSHSVLSFEFCPFCPSSCKHPRYTKYIIFLLYKPSKYLIKDTDCNLGIFLRQNVQTS